MQVQTLIENYGQNDQRTEAWHLKRGERLTASEIWKAVRDSTPASRHELIMSKLVPKPPTAEGFGPRALIWGTRFEPIAKDIYSKMQGGIPIVDTTCIPHPSVSFLGASPDGILVPDDPNHPSYGRLVEFKCPISRDFDESTPVPNAYYHQMQLQMECTGLNQCDYIEMKFREINNFDWLASDAEYKGFFVIHVDNGSVKYPEFEYTGDVPKWRRENLGSDSVNWDTLFWEITKIRTKLVEKDVSWLETHLPTFTEVWNTILHHRSAGTLPDHPKEKNTLTL